MMISPGEYFLDLGARRLRYTVAGAGPVVMVQAPGWGIGCGLYERTLAMLTSHFTMIHHEPTGSGLSDAPADPRDLNVGTFAEDLESLRRHLSIDRFALIGHSHGGFIALNYALRYPQRVSHLVPMDAQLGVEEPRADVQRTLPELAKDPRFADAAKYFAAPWQLETDDDLGTMLSRVFPLYFHDPTGAGFNAARDCLEGNRFSVGAMKATADSNDRSLVRDKLGAIDIPTLVMVGRHDFICSPVQAQVIHDGIPGSKLAVFETSGHFPWLEEPDAFLWTLSEFLGAPVARTGHPG